MKADRSGRLRTLDLIRGIAVLGILAVNITGFSAPESASYTPLLAPGASWADSLAYAATLLLFEGKMRALFSILFGASLLLFVDRADAAGQSGALLQVRRLLWLMLFGYLHFALIWDGDILFLYAVVGLVALALRAPDAKPLTLVALLFFALWQGIGTAMWLPATLTEAQAASSAPAAQVHAAQIADRRSEDARARALALDGFAAQVAERLTQRPAFPLQVALYNWGETLCLMLIGMALMKSGFFAGQWPRVRLWRLALGGIGAGGAATIAFTCWAWSHGWPEMAMHLALGYALGFPHLAMALGYAALLALAAPRLLAARIGQRLEAAGRMAFSNYIGTSAVMTALFGGWGLGLFGRYGPAQQWLFVGLGWILMLAWSQPWLARFTQGPLEWLWRSLTLRQMLPLKRVLRTS